MIFDYIETLTSTPKRLTIEAWNQLTESDHVKIVCAQVAAGHKELKKNLPAIMWQATYNGKPRKNENAESSGLYMLDIDHIDQPDTLFHTFEDRLEELGIYIVHKTPSTKGLRVVALCRPEHETIADNQAWLAKELKVEHDACTRDLARLSFLVPEDYFYFYNPEVFSLETEKKEQKTEVKEQEKEVKEEVKEKEEDEETKKINIQKFSSK